MNAGVVGPPDPVQQGSRFMATRGGTMQSPVSASGVPSSVIGKDSVDLVGAGSVGNIFRMLHARGTAPVPEAVGQAIRALVQEVLDDLPSGGPVVR